MLEDSISYPLRGEWIGRIGIGGILTVLMILFFPAFLLFGYYVRVMDETTQGRSDPPEFTDWGELFVNGILAFIISLVYALIPIVGWFVVVFGVIGTGSLVGGDGGGLLAGVGLLMILALVPLLFLVSYIVPAVLANFAATGSIGGAFDFGTLTSLWLSIDYIIAVVLIFAINLAVQIVASILGATVIGLVLVPFVLFYSNMVFARLIGIAYVESVGRSSRRATSGVSI